MCRPTDGPSGAPTTRANPYASLPSENWQTLLLYPLTGTPHLIIKSTRFLHATYVRRLKRVIRLMRSAFARAVIGKNYSPLRSYGRLSLLPAVALAQAGDMRDVMAAVPRIERQRLLQRHHPQFRMAEGPLPFCGRKRAQQAHPARMQRFQ